MILRTTTKEKVLVYRLYIYNVDSPKRSKNATFRRQVSIDKNNQARITIPHHIIKHERIKDKDYIEFKIKSVED